MRYQDQVVKGTQKALGDICRAALAVPPEKAEWRPLGEMRSVLDQMQEIATEATYFIPILRHSKAPAMGTHERMEAVESRGAFDTIQKCIEEARCSTAALCQAIECVSDDHLEQEITLPFAHNQTMTIADVLVLPWWNMVYHLGQINQIQLMLGDKEMH